MVSLQARDDSADIPPKGGLSAPASGACTRAGQASEEASEPLKSLCLRPWRPAAWSAAKAAGQAASSALGGPLSVVARAQQVMLVPRCSPERWLSLHANQPVPAPEPSCQHGLHPSSATALQAGCLVRATCLSHLGSQRAVNGPP
jgi:hypothetical protein